MRRKSLAFWQRLESTEGSCARLKLVFMIMPVVSTSELPVANTHKALASLILSIVFFTDQALCGMALCEGINRYK